MLPVIIPEIVVGCTWPGGGGESAYERGCSSEIVNKTPKGDRSGRVPRFFLIPKRGHVKTQMNEKTCII